MGAYKDMTNHTEGDLYVIGDSGERYGKNGAVLWWVRCICGAVVKLRRDMILKGKCLTEDHYKNLGLPDPNNFVIGQQVNQFTVIDIVYELNFKKYKVECSCGEIKLYSHSILLKREHCGESHYKNLGIANPNRKGDDITGRAIDQLKILGDFGDRDEHNAILWTVECSCGNITLMTQRQINRWGHCGEQHYINTGTYKPVGVRETQIVGDLTVIRKIGPQLWEVECTCGLITEMSTSSINFMKKCGHNHEYNLSLTPEQKKAGLLKTCSREKRGTYKGETCPPYIHAVFRSYRDNEIIRAKKIGRDIQFELSIDQFFDVAIGTCTYCGAVNPRRIENDQGECLMVCGVDRIDNNKGYVKGNIITCCSHCNLMKYVYEPDIFINKIKSIVKQQLQPAHHVVTYLTKEDQEQIYNTYRGAERRCAKKGLPLTISLQDFTDIMTQSCYYCGVEKSIGKRGYARLNGVDRIDSSKGYTFDNAKPCCSMCNKMKNKRDVNVFLAQVHKIYHYITQ